MVDNLYVTHSMKKDNETSTEGMAGWLKITTLTANNAQLMFHDSHTNSGQA